MRKLNCADTMWIKSWCFSGFLLAFIFPFTGIVVGYGSSTEFTAESGGRQNSQSTLPSSGHNKEEEGSPVIGGGVRKPPDIGAAGTASPTPPVRTESPTDEPAIIPDVSPVPTHPSDTESSPVADGQPLGQPDHLKKKQE